MTKTNRTAISAVLVAIIAAALIVPWTSFAAAQAQTETVFRPADKFSIPQYNGTISFSTGGTYEQASLENDSWTFVNLYLNNSPLPNKLNLKASAENSTVTITIYRTINTTLGGVTLRYMVTGQGKQTFNFGAVPKLGEWSVTFNGVYIGENDGWTVSPDSTITLRGATANVTIAYYTLPGSFGNPSTSNESFYQQHSVVIATAVAAAIAVVITVVIWRKNRNKNETA